VSGLGRSIGVGPLSFVSFIFRRVHIHRLSTDVYVILIVTGIRNGNVIISHRFRRIRRRLVIVNHRRRGVGECIVSVSTIQ
jgi:hypothetical protein